MSREDDPPGITFWWWTGLFGKGHVSYAPGALEKEGPFRNPARMVEDIMGANPTRGEAGGRFDNRSDSEQQANIWRLTGWWDK